MQAQLNKILEEAKEQLKKASTLAQTDEIRVKILGKKGQLTEILRGMGKLSPEERKETGQMANKVRSEIEGLLEEKFKAVKEAAKEAQFRMEKLDVTEPGRRKASSDHNYRGSIQGVYEHGIFHSRRP